MRDVQKIGVKCFSNCYIRLCISCKPYSKQPESFILPPDYANVQAPQVFVTDGTRKELSSSVVRIET